MPRFSAFTRFGFLRYSSRPSAHELAYRAMRHNLGVDLDPPTFDASIGTHVEATLYADAAGIARGKAILEKAKNQRDPTKALAMLSVVERDWGLAPVDGDTVHERRAALRAKAVATDGARRSSIEAAMRAIFGADFQAYRTLTESEQTTLPSSPGAVGNFPRISVTAKTIALIDAFPSGTQTVPYRALDQTAPVPQLAVGDKLCVEPEIVGLAENVTITAVGTVVDAGETLPTFTATFSNGHSLGASATTGPAPIWWSTRRTALIVVLAPAALDPDKRRRANEAMNRLARGVSQWSIVQPSSDGTVGPFALGISALGADPIHILSYTPL